MFPNIRLWLISKRLHYHLLKIVVSKDARTAVTRKLCTLFTSAGCRYEQARLLSEKVVSSIGHSLVTGPCEEDLFRLLRTTKTEREPGDRRPQEDNLLMSIRASFRGRETEIYKEISPYIEGDTILDFGCGRGSVGKFVHEKTGKDVVLSDIIDSQRTGLPFILFKKDLPFPDGHFGTGLLLMVLHHSTDQGKILRELGRVCRRIIVIETVFEDRKDDSRYDLSETAFFDWFYNRVILADDTAVPCNFRTSGGWETFFKENKFRVVHSEYLGMNYNNIFLNHHLYIIEGA